MAIWQWSRTAASNANADPTISFPEGQPPSTLNDSDRALMARVAEWYSDTGGTIADTGTASAYVVTTFEGVQTPTPADNTRISFTPANTNSSGVTLAVDGGTAFAIQSPIGTGIPAGTMIASTPYDLVFKASASVWVLKNLFGVGASPVIIPLGGIIDFTGFAPPNSNFVFPFGQAISRTTYGSLFGLVGTTFGTGDGSTTFNVPDLRGRALSGLDNMGGTAAGRLTSGTSMGIAGGNQSYTLTQANLPNVNFSVTDPGHSHGGNGFFVGASSNQSTPGAGNNTPISATNSWSTASATTGISVNSGGSGTAFGLLPPLMVVNKILRVL